MKIAITPGTTSKRMKVFIRDSSSTTGGGLTGLVYNSASLTWYYTKDGDSSATQVTLADATVGTWTSGGFKQIDATNMPGVYEIGVPNAAIAAGDCHMMLKGATNMVPVAIEIQTASMPAHVLTLATAALDAIWAAVWNVATASLVSAGSIGAALVDLLTVKMAGITSVARWMCAQMGKTADASTQAEIRAVSGGAAANYTITTDSLEAIADAVGDVPTAAENAAAVVAAVGDGITLVSPLSTDGGTLTFTQGDDLYTADGKAPIWTLTGTFPSWAGATGELRLTSGGITKTITITDAQIQDTGSTRTITAEIPRATTGSLPEDPAGSFQVMVQLSSGHQFTEVKNGVLVVQRRIA